MKFDINLAAIHGYLCGDGYVIKNPENKKHKYYHIGFRNTNQELLLDFQNKFYKFFKIRPHITNEGRCRIQSKRIYGFLTKHFSYYSYEWIIPNLPKKLLKYWLRAFFDCEGWVECVKAKNRAIKLECVNLNGIEGVKKGLNRFGINSNIKVRKRKNKIIYRLGIFGYENIKKFKNKISFLHPKKKRKLEEAINSYSKL